MLFSCLTNRVQISTDGWASNLGRPNIQGLYVDGKSFGSLAGELEMAARMAGFERQKRIIVP